LETEISATEPYPDFLFSMENSPITMVRYSTRLRSFFVYIGIEGTTKEEMQKVCRKGERERRGGEWQQQMGLCLSYQISS
jgi:hypothetical protein